MAFTQKSDTKIMELLKTKEIRHYIAQTDLGDLTLMLRKGETKYRLVLDSVPVSDEIHDELMNLLYPSKIEIPQVKKHEEYKEWNKKTTLKAPVKKVVKKK